MKKTTLAIAALCTFACSGDTTESGVAKVDVEDPATVLDPDGDGQADAVVTDDVASMTFTLTDPLPDLGYRSDGSMDEALLDVLDSFDLVVSSPRTGVTASLTADGTLVPPDPSGPGEWSVDISDDRKEFTVSWYNETRSGLHMTAGETYDMTWSLGDNCCINRVGDTVATVVLK